MATAPMKSMRGELMAWARTELRLARKRRRAAWRKRSSSQNSMLKALTMRLPVMVSWRMFWISASLSWPLRVVWRTPRPILRMEPMTMGMKISRTQASLPPRKMTTAVVKMRVKACWRKSERTEEMAYWTRSMSLMSAERRVPVAWR